MSPMCPVKLMARPAGFEPDNLSGLQLWFDAADISSITLEAGNKVSQWSSRAGGGHYANNAVSNEQPVFTENVQHGKPALVFNGTSHRLRLPTFSHAASDWTLLLAARPTSAVGTLKYWLSSQQGGGSMMIGHLTSSFGQTGYFDSGWRNLASATTGSQILAIRLMAGDGGLLRRNGAVAGSHANYSQEAIGTSAAIAARDDLLMNALSVSLFELLLYDRGLTTAELEANERRLAQRWGIALA